MALTSDPRIDLTDVLDELARVIASPDLAQATSGIERIVASALDAGSVAVRLLDPAGLARVAAGDEPRSGEDAPAAPTASLAGASGPSDPEMAALERPLAGRDGRPLGSVVVHAGPGRTFGPEDDRLLRALLSAAGAAIERQQLVAALEDARHQRQAFFGVVSHELRTPITTIYGGTRVLRQSGGRLSHDARQQLLDDIAQEAERLYRLVEDLLVLSRAEREALVVAAEPILIQHLVSRVVASEQQRWPRAVLRASPDRGLPPVLGDSTLVEQVLRNLVGNAAKYAGDAGPIDVTATRSGSWVEVRVLDEGPGLAPGDEDRVFDLFFRAADAASRAQGAGIGLYACRQLITAMGGEIWVDRRPTGGAAFGFRLQAEPADDDLDGFGPR